MGLSVLIIKALTNQDVLLKEIPLCILITIQIYDTSCLPTQESMIDDSPAPYCIQWNIQWNKVHCLATIGVFPGLDSIHTYN